MSTLADALAERGVLETWTDILAPVLVAAGNRWQRTGEGIDVEHLLSEVAIDAFRAHRARQLPPSRARPVLIACSPNDLHTLPLHALGAALAERRRPTRILGSRLPETALVSAAKRTGAAAVFVWKQVVTVPGPADEIIGVDVAGLTSARPRITVVVGGPGWDDVALTAQVRRSESLAHAVEILAGLPT